MNPKPLFPSFLGLLLALPLSLGLLQSPEHTSPRPVPAQLTDAPDICSIHNQAFLDGEEVRYKVYYNLNFVWVPAGEVVFTVKDKGEQYHIRAEGRTYSSYEWFFKVRDTYDTYIDKKTLLPTLFIRDVQEGGYTLYEKVSFDQKKRTAHVVRGRSKDNIKERKDYPIDACMHDMLSIVYLARNLDYNRYQSGQSFPVKIFLDKEEWPLQVAYKGKETDKKIKGLGRYNTILFSPEVIAGEVFKEGTEMKVWVSDDGNKIPLLIESPLSVGSVKVVLQEHKGLRYPM
jgi:hypothetical protein